jgi:hypothetical protein
VPDREPAGKRIAGQLASHADPFGKNGCRRTVALAGVRAGESAEAGCVDEIAGLTM